MIRRGNNMRPGHGRLMMAKRKEKMGKCKGMVEEKMINGGDEDGEEEEKVKNREGKPSHFHDSNNNIVLRHFPELSSCS